MDMRFLNPVGKEAKGAIKNKNSGEKCISPEKNPRMAEKDMLCC